MSDYVTEALHDATLDQIADELSERFGNVVLGCHARHPGTIMLKRGDLCVCLGIHTELGWFLQEKYDDEPTRDMGEGN